VTPEEQFRLLRGKSKEIDDAVQKAFNELMRLLDAGEIPRDAVAKVMATFQGEYAAIYAAGLSVVIAESIGAAAAITAPIGRVTLSQRLYTQSEAVSSVVQGVVNKHRQGFNDSRNLALELFEGYGFKEEEILTISKRNRHLPRYMREALLDSPQITGGFKRAFGKMQVENLSTPELQAAYRQVLKEIESIEAGASGKNHLRKKLDVAFNERVRYFAKRIAETELHRNYANNEARIIMADVDIEYVQWRLSPRHPIVDICDYFAGQNRYGLGRGVYPKAEAPVAPAHPFCKCVLSPRLDLTGRSVKLVDDAEAKFFSGYSQDSQRRIAGSKAKLDMIKSGRSAWDVHNAGIDPEYQVKPARSV